MLLALIRQIILVLERYVERIFPLPSRERARVRGRYKPWSPSPLSSPIRDCVAIPFMVREPHHERDCSIVNSSICPFALSLSKGSEHIATQSLKGEEISGRGLRPTLKFLGIAILSALLHVNSATAENVKIGIPSLTVTMMPIAVAKEQGFFQKEGLNVETVLMPASLNIKVLLSGDIQYATTITAGVVANVRGVNTRVVMCFVDRPLLDLVGNPEIGSIADLKGKLVAISSRGGLHYVTIPHLGRGSYQSGTATDP